MLRKRTKDSIAEKIRILKQLELNESRKEFYTQAQHTRDAIKRLEKRLRMSNPASTKDYKIGQTITYDSPTGYKKGVIVHIGRGRLWIKIKETPVTQSVRVQEVVQSNPSSLLKAGEWTPAHAVRIRKGKLEILR
jgi:hypothetical protein